MGSSRAGARFSLGAVIGTVLVGLLCASGVSAHGLPLPKSSESPGPSPSTSCMVPIPAGAPTPAPLCTTVTPSPAPEPSESPGKPDKPKNPKQKSRFKVTIVYKAKADVFVGFIESTGKCEDLRRVYVYKLLKGKDEKVGKDITDEHAKYSIADAAAEGKYYAKVPASVSIGYAAQVDCERLKSKPITIVKPVTSKK